ncbi:MAG: ATP-dependent DNA helicase RecG, partial [Oscillospiraceae bacterium]|nr:ATP-dependent DNA helicase RecG [Oscillospiraceae bacterium]
SLSCALELLRHGREGDPGPVLPRLGGRAFAALLPFSPTQAQLPAMGELEADMTSGRPMNRLLQGDVGSGKTAVAAYGAWLAWQGGFQCALMAPTEILAQQHFATLSALLSPAGMRVALLTGSTPAREKRALRAALAAGEIDLAVGTHALLSEGVEFSRLALVVADEQHRFGVAQRAALAAKAGGIRPHVLVMSATPIPRTLALMIYGDLDLSVLDQMPPGRTPVQTFLIGLDKRERLYNFVRKLAGQGRQIYIVCPAVEDSETEDVKAVTSYARQLQTQVFPDLRVGLVHGKLKAKEKQQVMAAFAAGEIHVLVSTTVVEVGVDVPNAALMIVENAERFGLSQLHQLRGRVGRGSHQSYCVLLSDHTAPETRQRLRVLTQTTDGFRISEEDLKARGPGDFFGQRQHGLPQLHMADLAGDMRVLKQAQQAAQELLAQDPTLERPEHRPRLAPLRRMFAQGLELRGQ